MKVKVSRQGYIFNMGGERESDFQTLNLKRGGDEGIINGNSKFWSLFIVDLEPIRSSVLFPFNLREFEVNKGFILRRQLLREDGGSLELGLVKR